jgi:hypothetical protein
MPVTGPEGPKAGYFDEAGMNPAAHSGLWHSHVAAMPVIALRLSKATLDSIA